MGTRKSFKITSVLFVFSLFIITSSSFADVRKKIESLPERLILGTDGISLEVIENARSKGLFKKFLPPSKMLAPYPSMSDVSWADITQTTAPQGVNRLYFNPVLNEIRGGPFSDLTTHREFERRFHTGDSSTFHHLKSYLGTYKLAMSELKDIEKEFFEAQGIKTYFAYTSSCDSFMHGAWESLDYLKALDSYLNHLLEKYKKLTGKVLEISLVSDHGNNRIIGKNMDIVSPLEAKGYTHSKKLKNKSDFAHPRAGVINYGGIFTASENREDIAMILSPLKGVQNVIYKKDDGSIFIVRHRNGITEKAEIKGDGEKFAILNISGDPMDYQPVIDSLKTLGKLDSNLMASHKNWFDISKNHEFPYVPVRVWRAYNGNTIHYPADVFVNLEDGYVFANPLLNKLKKVNEMHGGTHGSLKNTASIGYMMSSTNQTLDLPSHRILKEYFKTALPSYPGEKHWLYLDNGFLMLSIPNPKKNHSHYLELEAGGKIAMLKLPQKSEKNIFSYPLNKLVQALKHLNQKSTKFSVKIVRLKDGIKRSSVSESSHDYRVLKSNQVVINGNRSSLQKR